MANSNLRLKLDELKAALDQAQGRVQADVATMQDQIAKLQAAGGGLSAEDAAYLNDLIGKVNAFDPTRPEHLAEDGTVVAPEAGGGTTPGGTPTPEPGPNPTAVDPGLPSRPPVSGQPEGAVEGTDQARPTADEPAEGTNDTAADATGAPAAEPGTATEGDLFPPPASEDEPEDEAGL